MDRPDTGAVGETIARDFLQKKGYQIIAQNVRNKYSEIDLIARKKDVLVFVEVRTKSNETFGSPEQTIDRKKINRLIRSAEAYTSFNKYTGEYRVDAVCVVLDPIRISHYESITM